MSKPFLRVVPVALAVVTIVAAGAAATPGDSAGRGVRAVPATVPPSPTTLVCPPAPALAAGTAEAGAEAGFIAQPVAPESTFAAATYRASGEPPVLYGHSLPVQAAGPARAGQEKTGSDLPVQPGALPRITTDPGGPAVVIAAADAQAASPVGALTSTSTAEGDLAGLAMSACSVPSTTSWLLGGGVAAGRSGRIVLSNAGGTPVTVDLTLLTPKGPGQPVAGQDLVIAPGQSSQVLLEALSNEPGSTAVGVSARGGQVAANLVDTRLDGIVPRGVEQVSSVSAASEQVLTPITVAGGATTLELANPGKVDAEVSWRYLGADGVLPAGQGSGSLVLAGSTAVVPISPPPGARALAVTSRAPVLAAASIVRERDAAPAKAADVALVTPGPALGQSSLVVTGPAQTRLWLAGGTEPSTVVVRQVDGAGAAVAADQTLAIPADAATAVDLGPTAVAVEITVKAGTVHGGLLATGGVDGSFVAAAAVQTAAAGQRRVDVRVAARP